MKDQLLNQSLRNLLFQRNALLGLNVLLAISVAVVASLLFFKQDRVVVIPSGLSKMISIEGNKPSTSYLEQMGIFVGKLLLEKNPASSAWQREMVLKHASPHFYSALRARLVEEEQMISNEKASYTFNIRGIDVLPDESAVILEGDRAFFMGGKLISQEVEQYRIGFLCNADRVLLDSVEEVAK